MLQINILAWNCRGIVNHETQRALVDLVQAKRPSILFLSETLALPRLLDTLRARMGFVGCICYPCKESSQGLAMFWVEDVPVRLRTFSSNHIDADVRVLGSSEIWSGYEKSTNSYLGSPSNPSF